MEILKPVKYQLKVMNKSLGIYFLIWMLTQIVLPYIGILFASEDVQNVGGDILLPMIIFTTIFAISIERIDFNLLVQNGISRGNYNLNKMTVQILEALEITTILLVCQILINRLFSEFTLTIYLMELYNIKNWLVIFIGVFLSILLTTTLGTLLGTMLNRFQIFTKLLIGLLLLMIIISIPVIIRFIDINTLKSLLKIILSLFGIDIEKGFINIWPFYGMEISFVVIFSGITYLMNRRREIKKINA